MVMMEQAFWLILFLAVVGIAALIAAAMMWQKESIQQPGTPPGSAVTRRNIRRRILPKVQGLL